MSKGWIITLIVVAVLITGGITAAVVISKRKKKTATVAQAAAAAAVPVNANSVAADASAEQLTNPADVPVPNTATSIVTSSTVPVAPPVPPPAVIVAPITATVAPPAPAPTPTPVPTVITTAASITAPPPPAAGIVTNQFTLTPVTGAPGGYVCSNATLPAPYNNAAIYNDVYAAWSPTYTGGTDWYLYGLTSGSVHAIRWNASNADFLTYKQTLINMGMLKWAVDKTGNLFFGNF